MGPPALTPAPAPHLGGGGCEVMGVDVLSWTLQAFKMLLLQEREIHFPTQAGTWMYISLFTK